METSKVNNWTFDSVENTPSVKNGMSTKQEWEARFVGCNLIKYIGMQEGFCSFTLYYACMLFHRYFMFKSLKACKYQEIALTCLSLSAKINYQSKYDMKSLIRGYESIQNNHEATSLDKIEYDKWRKTIIYYEEYILRTLYFDLEIRNPFKYSVDKVSKFNSLLSRQDQLPTSFIQCIFAILGDSVLSSICILHTTLEMVGAAWLLSLQLHEHVLEADVREKIVNSIKKDAHMDDVLDAVTSIFGFYTKRVELVTEKK